MTFTCNRVFLHSSIATFTWVKHVNTSSTTALHGQDKQNTEASDLSSCEVLSHPSQVTINSN